MCRRIIRAILRSCIQTSQTKQRNARVDLHNEIYAYFNRMIMKLLLLIAVEIYGPGIRTLSRV